MSNLFYEQLQKKSDETYEKEIYNKAIKDLLEKCKENSHEVSCGDYYSIASIEIRDMEDLAESLLR